MEDIVNISDLNKWFGTFHVLKDINLSVKPKDRIVIAGPSGSGKTSLLDILGGRSSFDSGSITINEDSSVQILAEEAHALENLGEFAMTKTI